MQSQQKKVKWSRGETANALEERTDTGITQVSVSKMENIIADVYGNISRRPALRLIKSVDGATEIPLISSGSAGYIADYSFIRPPQSFVFTIDANTYIVFISDQMSAFGGLLIQNNKFVRRISITNLTPYSVNHSWEDQISVAQYNNYMVVSNLYTYDVVFKLTGTDISTYGITVDDYQFSAPWYAPNGTESIEINTTQIPGLEFNHNADGFFGTTYTEENGSAVSCSAIDTGLTGSVDTIAQYIPRGSIVEFPNMGAYMRVEGFSLGQSNVQFTHIVFDTLVYSGSPTPTGYCAVLGYLGANMQHLSAFYNGTQIGMVITNKDQEMIVRSSVSQTGYSHTHWGAGSWQDFSTSSLKVFMYGELLTPVANDQKKDGSVVVETGYISLNNYEPTRFTFSNQRLYASAFYNASLSPKQIPGYAVGSQIGRYNDFKNNYNTKTEAVVIDISTSYQEEVLYLVDYNGLKIMTDAAEYAYINGGVVKQSSNGSLKTCQPIVFGSICIYADKSGGQLRAMQYEFQNQLFDSSSINKMTQEDLIFNTSSMAGFFDKEHFTGHFLYTVQTGYNRALSWTTPKADHSLAVCNLVPGNQAEIWTRWTSPEIKISDYNRHSVSNIIEINNKVWFVVGCVHMYNGNPRAAYTLAELDYDNLLDMEVQEDPTSTAFSILPQLHPHNLYAWVDGADTVYTMTEEVLQGDPIYDAAEQQIATAENSPGGPNIIIDGVGYYAWQPVGGIGVVYTKEAIPSPVGDPDDPSRQVFDENGDVYPRMHITGYNTQWNQLMIAIESPIPGFPSQVVTYERIYSVNTLQYTIAGTTHNATYTSAQNIYAENATIPGIISVFDGDTFMWNDTIGIDGTYSRSLADLENPRVGFMINATLESHPIDIQGKTYTEKKRIGKCVAVIRDTESGAFTVCDKTGYTAPDKKTVNFYGCTGMKDQVRYTIKNIKGAKFTIESLTMIIEYGTLDS